MLLYVLTVLLAKPGSTEVYSSFNSIRNLNNIENHMVELLKNYIEREKVRLATVERFYDYIADIKDGTDPDLYIAYPTNQFNVIHRFVADWANVEEFTKSSNDELISAFTLYSEYFPDSNDIKGAVKAIHRLQDMYKITSQHFARGDTLGEFGQLKGQPLNIKALLVLTSIAYEMTAWGKCAGWGQQAYLLAMSDEEYTPESEVWFDVADHFSYCLYKIGEMNYAMEVTNEMLEYYPTHERLLGNKAYFLNNLDVEAYDEFLRDKRSVIEEPTPFLHEIGDKDDIEITYVPKVHPGADETVLSEEEIVDTIEDEKYQKWGERVRKYNSLCNEQAPLSPEIRVQVDRLTCYYKGNTPRTYIQPIKTEIVWPSPRLTIFHDVISDAEAGKLMALAEPLLTRATVHNKETGKLENAEYRVSKTAWLDMDGPDDTDDVVRRINRRIEDATELSMELAELLQVNNYGMAGQYEPHYDMATRDETAFTHHDGGNRVATLLFYMGNTEAGGATTFIDAGVRLAPQKNGAVFWYNLLPNGDPDLLTRHAGCPVLAGTKWVMNKWIHANDQMFTRPCDIEESRREKDAKLYNGKYTL